MPTYTERSQENAKKIAAEVALTSHKAVRLWDASDDDMGRSGFLAEYHNDGVVFIYPLWTQEGCTTFDIPDVYDDCPSLEWFMSAKLEDHGEVELVGVNGDRLPW